MKRGISRQHIIDRGPGSGPGNMLQLSGSPSPRGECGAADIWCSYQVWWETAPLQSCTTAESHNLQKEQDNWKLQVELFWNFIQLRLQIPKGKYHTVPVLCAWNNGKSGAKLVLTSSTTPGLQIHKFDHSRTANPCDWLLCRRAALPLVGCPHSIVYLHLPVVEGLIFCISATPHLGTSFPLFHESGALPSYTEAQIGCEGSFHSTIQSTAVRCSAEETSRNVIHFSLRFNYIRRDRFAGY